MVSAPTSLSISRRFPNTDTTCEHHDRGSRSHDSGVRSGCVADQRERSLTLTCSVALRARHGGRESVVAGGRHIRTRGEPGPA
jgi:hypothetical protein